jgi:hypothetical protein
MELFDFITALFDKKEYAEISDNIKKKHFFMVQRMMSIKYPLEANNFNILNINHVSAVDFWHMVLTMTYSRKPNWLYTKSEKKNKNAIKDKIDKFKPDLINFWLRKKKIDERDFLFMKEVLSEDLYIELKRLEKITSDNNIDLKS